MYIGYASEGTLLVQNGRQLLSSIAKFVQGGRIAAGAYDYTLGRGTEAGQTGNWYLTSDTNNRSNDATEEPTERPEAGAYSANLAAANNMFVTRLRDRLGETQYTDVLTGEQKVTSLWLRNEGGHNRSRDESGQIHYATTGNRLRLQASVLSFPTRGSPTSLSPTAAAIKPFSPIQAIN